MSSRERIDAAALKLLADHGYDGLSMQSLADAVGLHKSTLFHHYKSKAEIAEHVVETVMARIVQRTAPRLAREPAALDDLVAAAEDLVDYFGSEPEAAKLLLRVVLADGKSPLAVIRPDHPLTQLITSLLSWFERARANGAIRFVRMRHTLFNLMGVMVFHPASAATMGYIAGPTPFSPEEREKRKADVAAFLRGALAPTEPSAPATPAPTTPVGP